MVSKESAVKKYIVILSDAEREQLTALIHSGKHPAQIPPQWDGQSVHDVRATGRLAARQGHRPPHGGGLCPGAQGTIRHTLPRFGENRARPGQPEHAQARIAYEAFPPAEARRLVERFEWHYTPKHGSWLDMAESELGVLSSQCLDRRIPDQKMLKEEVEAWEAERNRKHAKADWQFTTADARVKLKRLYPAL